MSASFDIPASTLLFFAQTGILVYLVWMGLRMLGVSLPLGRRGGRVEAPIISSHQLLGGTRLTSIHKGKMSGFSYNLMSNHAGNIMVLVELGHNSHMHLIAVGDKSGLDPIIHMQVQRHYLEKIVLEGDFPAYFHIYATPSKQMELRRVLEPRNMAYLVDFCRSYNVEIFLSSLYISQAQGTTDHDDSTTMTHDLDNFLRENKHMLKRL